MMRKAFYMLMIAAIGLVAVSCSGPSGSSDPGKAAKGYAQYLADGNYNKFVEYIDYSSDVTPEELAEAKAMIASLMEEKAAPKEAARGKVKNIVVVSQELLENGERASVQLRLTYNDNSTEDVTYKLVKREAGWRMEAK